ncbi:hypothetical protein [Ottowia testudinis]|uniref:Uncharacterized protein n=1 Tax=Ottowia testudinis TaxID=2816950 RepID=A0A975CEJ2_9BURK|nr:hypothetical protein [Ottowia testudinis]QTD44316.1 hypothetical protein J1M35_14505 [Ottowia testudinis]
MLMKKTQDFYKNKAPALVCQAQEAINRGAFAQGTAPIERRTLENLA